MAGVNWLVPKFPQESPISNHSRSSHPPTASGVTGFACSGDILAARQAHPASLTTPESLSTAAPDARFDHTAEAIIVRKTYHLLGCSQNRRDAANRLA